MAGLHRVAQHSKFTSSVFFSNFILLFSKCYEKGEEKNPTLHQNSFNNFRMIIMEKLIRLNVENINTSGVLAYDMEFSVILNEQFALD